MLFIQGSKRMEGSEGGGGGDEGAAGEDDYFFCYSGFCRYISLIKLLFIYYL